MFQLPDRAPIPYTEMRQPFNLLRLSGATVFAVASVLVAVFESDPAPLWVLIPAAAVFVDAAVRLRVKSTPLPALIVDASAMFTAIALRGPSLTTGAVALCYLLVAASLLLPMLDAIAIVAYGGVLWVAIGLWGDGFASGPVGAIGRAGFARGFDRIMVGVVLVAVASIMLRAVRSLLDAQDRQSEALAQERRAVEL
ncbi:MAG: hypothetical protein KDB69_05160, partial [Acidimicrobiia bacterium]|nr:hypothetical protein [Acidimicrobiia bacterium]